MHRRQSNIGVLSQESLETLMGPPVVSCIYEGGKGVEIEEGD